MILDLLREGGGELHLVVRELPESFHRLVSVSVITCAPWLRGDRSGDAGENQAVTAAPQPTMLPGASDSGPGLRHASVGSPTWSDAGFSCRKARGHPRTGSPLLSEATTNAFASSLAMPRRA